MASLHPLADVDDGQPLRRFTEGLRQKYRETQSGDNDSDENELYDTMSVGYEDKSTQTEPASSVDQTLDSLPELPSYEISQIISDVIDNLPPGSLLPLEESMFAPGSKRNLEYQAASKAGKGSLSRMSSNGKPKVSGWNDFQSSKEASKPDQTGFTFSNRFSSLADSGGPEKVSQATSKSLIGPGLYAKSVRSVSKEIDSEEVKSQIHTYSPGPGLLLRYESVERSPTRKDPTVAEKPRASSLYAPSTLHDAAETIISSQEMHLPPHLRAAQSSDPVKSSKASIKEPIHVGSAKAFHLDQPIVGEITPLTASAIKSIEVEGEDPSLPPSLTTSVVESVALEGEGPSPHVIKEDQSSPSTEKLPPHLRKAESQITQQDLHNPIAKSNESTSSPGSSTEKLAPHEKGKTPVPQQVLHVIDTNTKSNASITPPFSRTDNQVAPYEKSKTPAPQQILPVTGTDTKPNESTLSPFSKTDLLAPHRKSKALILQQVAPVIDTDTKPNESKVSPFFSTDKLKPQEKNEAPVAQHIIPVIDDIKTELIESMSSSFSSTDKLPPHKKGKNPVPQQVLPVGDTSTKLNNSKLSPLSGTEKLAPQGKSEAPVVRKSIPVTDTNTKPNESTLWPSSGTLDAISEPIRALGALGALGASSSKDVAPNLKEALYFKAWPKSEPRDTPGSFFSLSG